MIKLDSAARLRSGPGLAALLGACLLLALCAGLAIASDLPDYTPDSNDTRDQVPDEYKWSLDQLFPSVEAWQQAMDELAAGTAGLADYRGRLSDPVEMRKCLDLYFDLHDRINHATLFGNLSLITDLANDQMQSRQIESQKLMTDLMAASAFIRTEALSLDDAEMTAAYAHPDGPAPYKGYLDNLRRRRSRVVNDDAERILSILGDNLWAEIDLNEIISPLESAFNGMMADIDFPVVHNEDGEEVQLNFSNYRGLRRSQNREIRREAVEAMMATLRKYQHVFAATLGGQFWLDVSYARSRNYDTALEAYMDKDGLDTAVFENLVATINANLEPLHRYVSLRKKLLGLDEIHVYDMSVPIIAGAEAEISFAEAREILPKALAPLGEDYIKLLEQGLDPRNGWIDLYPHEFKESGAFSASVYGRHPYVKMNYQDSLDDMSTLAHEFGHALHSHFSMTEQPYSTFRYVPFLAEIASTCNEALLADYLLAEEKDKDLRATLLVERLDSIRNTIYRQTQFAEFEQIVHGYIEQGRPVTSQLLNETYGELLQRYFGPDFTMDDFASLEWAYIPHFYYKYYVYTYATGLSSGIALAEKIQAGGEDAVDAYLEMLKGGCSRPPLELLKTAGVDLTEPAAIEAAMKMFSDTLAELESLLES